LKNQLLESYVLALFGKFATNTLGMVHKYGETFFINIYQNITWKLPTGWPYQVINIAAPWCTVFDEENMLAMFESRRTVH
jgi:hypothetical protein